MQTKITSLFSSAPQTNQFWEADNFSDDAECLLVVVCSLLSARRFDYPKGAILVIVCPLVSLISYLTLFNVKAMIREK